MSLSSGRQLRLLPGPSTLPDAVLQAMMQPVPDIYDPALEHLTEGLVADLRALLGCSGHLAMYVGNGHIAWDAAAHNMFAPGDRVLVLGTGAFSHGWADVLRSYGVQVQMLDFGMHSAADPARLHEALRAPGAGDIRAVLCTQTDTATSASNDIAALGQAIRSSGHEALFMVDAVASAACEELHMDDWGVDLVLTASQKGLMCPPGMAFVFFSDRAAQAARHVQPGKYLDWRLRAKPDLFYQYFGGTAPTQHLFALRAALDMIAAEGRSAIWARHRMLAGAVWAAAGQWGSAGPLALNIAQAGQRSRAVTTLIAKGADCTALRGWLTANTGLTLGIGLGFDTPEYGHGRHAFRIAHMGHINATMLLGALGALETGLRVCGIAHAPGGVQAAADHLAAALGAQ